MVLKPHKQKQGTIGGVRRLTESEYESMMQDFKESGEWIKQELKRRKLVREKAKEK